MIQKVVFVSTFLLVGGPTRSGACYLDQIQVTSFTLDHNASSGFQEQVSESVKRDALNGDRAQHD